MAWPSTWTDRLDRDRTPSIPGHELAGGHRPRLRHDGTLAGTASLRLHRLTRAAPWPSTRPSRHATSRPCRATSTSRWARACRSRAYCVAGTVPARPPSGGAERPAHGAAGAVGSIVTQLALRPAPTSSARTPADRRRRSTSARRSSSTSRMTPWRTSARRPGLDVIGGDIGKRSAGLIRAGGPWCRSWTAGDAAL